MEVGATPTIRRTARRKAGIGVGPAPGGGAGSGCWGTACGLSFVVRPAGVNGAAADAGNGDAAGVNGDGKG
jgi:hypothetical protein